MNLDIILSKSSESQKILRRFYEDYGIGNEETLDNLNRKYRFMREIVITPDFPYNERTPSLGDLELQFLREQGFNYL